MLAIIFLCIINAIYLQCLCEISRQPACPLLRYCFLLADRTNGRAYATVLRLSVVCL